MFTLNELKMKTRICNQCGKEKLLSEFSKKSNGKFGVRSICKACTAINSKDYRKRTFKFQRNKIIKRSQLRRKTLPWVYILYGVRQRCDNPKATGYSSYGERGIKNFLQLKDIKFLWFRDKAFEMKRPSIDRINPDGNYEVSNCRFKEYEQNVKEHRVHIKPILQIDKKGNLLKEWNSLKQASDFYHIHSTAITQNLQGRSKFCNGFIWKYKDGEK